MTYKYDKVPNTSDYSNSKVYPSPKLAEMLGIKSTDMILYKDLKQMIDQYISDNKFEMMGFAGIKMNEDLRKLYDCNENTVCVSYNSFFTHFRKCVVSDEYSKFLEVEPGSYVTERLIDSKMKKYINDNNLMYDFEVEDGAEPLVKVDKTIETLAKLTPYHAYEYPDVHLQTVLDMFYLSVE